MPSLHDVESIAAWRGGPLRILGLPGSGRTRALVERWRSLRAEGHPARIVTWGAARRDAILERLVPDGGALVGAPPVATWSSLAIEVLRRSGEKFVGPLTELQEHAVLAGVLERTRPESDYRRVLDSPTLRAALLSALHALAQNDVAADRALALADSDAAPGGARGRDVLRLYAAWRAELERTRAVTFVDVAWRAAAAVRRDPRCAAIPADAHLLVDDFHDADAGQWALLRALAPPGGARGVTVAGDPTGARYVFRGTTSAFLLEAFPRDYACADAVLPPPAWLGGPAVAPLLEAAGVVGASSEPGTGEDDGRRRGDAAPGARPSDDAGVRVEAFRARDEMAEAREVARRVAARLEQGAAPWDVAIVVRRPEVDAARFRAALAEHRIPLSAPSARMDGLADLALAAVECLAEASRRPARTARLAQLPGFDAVCAAAGVDADGEAHVEALAQRLRERFVAAGVADVEALVHGVVAAAARAAGIEEPAELAGLGAVCDAWRRYAEVRAATRRDVVEFATLCRRWASVRRPVEPGGVVLVSPLEASARRWDHVFVAGLVDGVLPTRPRAPGYVPWRELADALAADAPHLVLAGARDVQAVDRTEHALILDACTRARRTLVLSAPVSHDGVEIEGPARAVAELLRGAGDAGVHDPPSPRWRTARALARVHAAGGCAAAAPADDARLRPAERLWVLPRPAAPLVRLPRFAMSASALGAWTACPRRFFYRYGLRLPEPDSLATEVGRVLHAVVDALARENRSRRGFARALNTDSAKAVVEAVCERSDVIEADTLVATVAPRAVQRRLERLARLEAQRDDDAHIAHVEWSGRFEHRGVEFAVRVDRVDRLDGPEGPVTIVVDYKTGSPAHLTGAKVFEKATEQYWQVPFYLGWVRHATGSWPTAFCYYYLGGDEPVAVGVAVDTPPPLPGRTQRFETIPARRAQELLDVTAEIAGAALSPREHYARVAQTKPCALCAFRTPCRRTGRR